jgi:hypothetical protein
VSLEQLGQIQREQGEAICVEKYVEASELYRKVGDTAGEAIAAFNLGHAYRESAQDDSYSVSWVRGDGAEVCPDASALRQEVARRLGRQSIEALADRAMEVFVERHQERFRSTIRVRSRDGRSLGARTLESEDPSCAAIFHATVLALVLAIDPNAASEEAATSVASFEARGDEPDSSEPASAAQPGAGAVPPAPPAQAAPSVVSPGSDRADA